MEGEIRKTGIDVIGDAPWGTHFCQFYETKEDLIDVLVPYFKVGLENNEFCMWVTSDPLSEEEAKEAMRRAVPDFDRYLKRRQIEIVPHAEWYLKDGAFNLQRVLNAWIDKLDQALAEGYDGIRVTGNTAWLEKRDWRSFVDYEGDVNNAISRYRMLAICTYSLDKCGASEVIDVVCNHQFALIKRRGEWELIESSERKVAEEALRKSEEKFRNLVQTIPECVYSALPNGEILYMSPAVETIFGYSAEEFQKDKDFWIRLIHKDDQEELLAKLEKLLEKGVPYVHEFRMRRKDGDIVWIRDHASAMLDKKGKPTRISGIIHDITERKKAEEELVRLSSAVKMSTDSIVISDMNAKIIDVNEATLEMYGTDNKSDLIGKNSFDLIAPEGRESALAGMREVLEKGYVKGREYQIITKNGGRILVEMNTAIMKDADGEPIGFVGVSRDITKRKQAEEALRESEEKFRNIFESANDCMALLDRSGRILDVNGKSVELFGGSEEELLGRHFTRTGVFSPKDVPRVMSAFAKLLAGKKTTMGVYIKNKKGREADVEVSATLMKINGKFAGILVIARDVTERKKAEEALRDSEEKYRNLVEKEKDIIYTLDDKGNITFASPAVETILGYCPEEVVGKHFMVLIPKEWQERTRADFNNLLRTGEITSETVLLDKKGQPHFVEYSSTVIKAGKKVVGTQGIVRDITERKKTEEEMMKTRAFLQSSLSSAPDGVFLIDKHGKLTYANPTFLKWIGYEAKDVIGKTIQEIVPKITASENAKIIQERAKRRLKTGEPITGVEVEIVDKDGKSMPASYSAAGIRDGEGDVIGEVVFVRDITERKNIEEKLRQYSERLEELVQKRTEELLESEKRYSVLVEEARDGVVILQDGKIVFINRKGPEIVGYSRDEVIGMPFQEIVDERYRQIVKERYRRRLRGEEVPASYEVEVMAKTGERVPVELGATRINYQGRPADLVIVRDIRERKRIEEERLRLEKLATIGELATMVGHDLRNPLQSIENATYYLSNELSRLPSSVPHHQKTMAMLEILGDSVNYADKIIRDLQDFSATKKPILEKTNINAIVKEALSQVEVPENVKLITELGRLPEIKTDKDMIKRAFLNLAINGIQAMEKGGRLKVSTKKTRGFVEVDFKDTGLGISKVNMEKIFTPFFTTRATGMGMGLPTSKKFIDAHGGSIEVESEEGKGSTFTVKLPIQ